MFPVLSSAQIARIASHGVIRPITVGKLPQEFEKLRGVDDGV